MKKTIALLLSLILCLGLCACGSAAPAAQSETPAETQTEAETAPAEEASEPAETEAAAPEAEAETATAEAVGTGLPAGHYRSVSMETDGQVQDRETLGNGFFDDINLTIREDGSMLFHLLNEEFEITERDPETGALYENGADAGASLIENGDGTLRLEASGSSFVIFTFEPDA